MTAEQFWINFPNKFPATYTPGQYRDIMEFAEAYAVHIVAEWEADPQPIPEVKR